MTGETFESVNFKFWLLRVSEFVDRLVRHLHKAMFWTDYFRHPEWSMSRISRMSSLILRTSYIGRIIPIFLCADRAAPRHSSAFVNKLMDAPSAFRSARLQGVGLRPLGLRRSILTDSLSKSFVMLVIKVISFISSGVATERNAPSKEITQRATDGHRP